jgi:hypothetical protein
LQILDYIIKRVIVVRFLGLLVVLLFIAGCSHPAVEPVDVPKEKQAPAENGVVRQFAKDTVTPGETVKVKLFINLRPEQTYYLYEEKPADEFTVIDVTTDSQGKVKGIEIQGAKSTIAEYSVQAPIEPGTYTFSGEYAVEGMANPAPILGETTITVQ